MCPSPTYGDRSEIDPSLPDEDEPARRSKARTSKDDPVTDQVVDPSTLKVGQTPAHTSTGPNGPDDVGQSNR